MSLLLKRACGLLFLAALAQPFSYAVADTEASHLSLQKSAPVNPFAPPRPASSPAVTPSVGTSKPVPGLPLPPPAFAPAKLPALPLPPPPEVPLPTFDGGGHAVSEPREKTAVEEGNVIGRARQSANCHLKMARTDASARAQGGNVVLNFSARTGRNCAKAAMPDADWIDVANLGDQAITLGVRQNDTGEARIGHVRIVSPDVGDTVTVTITQGSGS